MELNSLNDESENIDKNENNFNSNQISKNKYDKNIVENKSNHLVSFLTSKLGIIIIILISVIIIVIVILCVVLSKTDEKTPYENNQKNNEEEKEREKEKEIDYMYKDKLLSDTLYVKKIDNLPDDFILGMDLSSIISEENSGVKFYNFENKERDIFETLRYVGLNYIRIRIWNDPYDSEGHGYGGGNNDMDTAIKIGKRVTKYGMKVLASFHYSDFYADPGSQNVPKAWRGSTLDEKVKKAEEYTKESLIRFKNEGVNVGMIALGNEINDFFCGEKQWPNIVKILNACSKITRQILPNCLISVHLTNPEREGSMMYFAKSLYDNNLDYDVFSVSYYNVWSDDLSVLNQLNDVAEAYNIKIFIAETQYPYTRNNMDFYPDKTPGYDDFLYYPLTVQGQANHIRDLINYVAGIKNSIGVFYWEGAWIAVGTTNYYEIWKNGKNMGLDGPVHILLHMTQDILEEEVQLRIKLYLILMENL